MRWSDLSKVAQIGQTESNPWVHTCTTTSWHLWFRTSNSVSGGKGHRATPWFTVVLDLCPTLFILESLRKWMEERGGSQNLVTTPLHLIKFIMVYSLPKPILKKNTNYKLAIEKALNYSIYLAFLQWFHQCQLTPSVDQIQEEKEWCQPPAESNIVSELRIHWFIESSFPQIFGNWPLQVMHSVGS